MTAVHFSGCFSFKKPVLRMVIDAAYQTARAANHQARPYPVDNPIGRYAVQAQVQFRRKSWGPCIGFYAQPKTDSDPVTPCFPAFYQDLAHQQMCQLEDTADTLFTQFLTQQGLHEGPDYTYKRHTHSPSAKAKVTLSG